MAAPTAEDQANWVAIGLAILTIIVGAVSTLFWRMIGGLATKEDLAVAKADIQGADQESDLVIKREIEMRIEQMERRTEKRHEENQGMLREMREDIKSLLRGPRRGI